MITKDDIVPESTARLLFKKSFDEPCFFWYNSIHTLVSPSFIGGICNSNSTFKENIDLYEEDCCPVSAPTFQEVERWFRDTHHIDICVCGELNEYGKCFDGYIAVVYQNGCHKATIRNTEGNLTYEEASNKAIEYGLTLI